MTPDVFLIFKQILFCFSSPFSVPFDVELGDHIQIQLYKHVLKMCTACYLAQKNELSGYFYKSNYFWVSGSPSWILSTSLFIHKTFFSLSVFGRARLLALWLASIGDSCAPIGLLYPPSSVWLDSLELNHSSHLSSYRILLMEQTTNSNAGTKRKQPIIERKAGFKRTGVI